ncbi:LINGO [Mytilus edulis]|uniref:LINGO n=1 Tax=Mytilus edulis TaxID=6550 RepID=A0A8S3R616_MYTED|nr:LINGO [Mytilus edulis]
MRAQNVLQIDTFGTNKGQFESEAFELMDPNEQKMIFNCGKQRGIRYNKELKKSGSTTTLNINILLPRQQKKLRTLSAGHKPLSKGLNLEEARQQLARERQLAMARQRQESRSGRSTYSRLASARSEISSNVSCTTPSIRSISPATTYEKPETMWKGDKEILEMDLRRGLTTRVQKRIKTTTSALERVTGYGENNASQKTVGRCKDFPHLVDDDYGFKPKIIQKMRISPYLSNVIRTDIKIVPGFFMLLYLVYTQECNIAVYDNLSEKVKIADCSKRDLSEVPQSLPRDITVLDLSGNKFRHISNYSFENYSLLLNLSLAKNKLHIVEEHAFYGLSRLKFLNMTDNILNLRYVYTPKMFLPLQNLINLDIRRNIPNQPTEDVYHYPDQAFAVLKKLEYLALDMAPNPIFGTGFQGLNNLKSLTFEFCFLKYLRGYTFENFSSNLEELQLTRCHLNFWKWKKMLLFLFLKLPK